MEMQAKESEMIENGRGEVDEALERVMIWDDTGLIRDALEGLNWQIGIRKILLDQF